MEVTWRVLVLILCASLVTVVPRVLPLMILSRFSLPEWTLRWLGHIPIAVMAALVGQELFEVKGNYRVSDLVDWIAALLTFVVAAKTRSLLWSVLSGVACAWVLRMMV